MALTLAVAAPTLLAYNVSPSPTFLNQALSVGLWALVVLLARPLWPGRGVWPVLAALVVMAASVGWSWGPGALPASLALSALALIAAAAWVLSAAAGARQRGDGEALFTAWCWALAITGFFNVLLALVQVFVPDLPDSKLIAISSIAGRAVGNLRQPNHLSSVLLWSAIAVVALSGLKRLRWTAALPMLAALMLAVVLTASRTGLVSVLLLAVWGVVDRRLPKETRGLLVAAPLLYALAWAGMAWWGAQAAHQFGGAARLAETDISGSRFGIWANTLALIGANPFTGVGFGEFNFAWTLTPFPGRPIAFFDHTHNLPLQLAVELGLPLAALVMALLLWGLAATAWRGFGPGADTGAVSTEVGIAQRAALMMVLMIGLHSLLEYPLWYAYFLLPTAWVWGFALGADAAPAAAPARAARASRVLVAGALLMGLGALLSVWDYRRVAVIFYASPAAGPLPERIAAGQQSVLFAHHADYAALTAGVGGPGDQGFERAVHHLLDTRLMVAWARALNASGQTDAARFVAARLHEFGRAESGSLFEPCAATAGLPAAEKPFQCSPPERAWAWREFIGGPR
jgi:O-antigen ligase